MTSTTVFKVFVLGFFAFSSYVQLLLSCDDIRATARAQSTLHSIRSYPSHGRRERGTERRRKGKRQLIFYLSDPNLVAIAGFHDDGKGQIIYIWFISFHNCISLFVASFFHVRLLYLFYCVHPKIQPFDWRSTAATEKRTQTE